MQFLLDPAIARKFGRDAIASVEKAEGVLATSNVSGENVGADIASSQVRSAGMEAEVKRIEERLAGKGLANDERVELRRRAEELRDMMGGEKETRRNGEKRIATTPVQFNYSGNMGIGGSGAFGDALSASTNSMTSMLGAVADACRRGAALVAADWRGGAVRQKPARRRPAPLVGAQYAFGR